VPTPIATEPATKPSANATDTASELAWIVEWSRRVQADAAGDDAAVLEVALDRRLHQRAHAVLGRGAAPLSDTPTRTTEAATAPCEHGRVDRLARQGVGRQRADRVDVRVLVYAITSTTSGLRLVCSHCVRSL
jgi:hypothetical protein